MAYFEQFPQLAYKFSDDQSMTTVTDIIRRIKVRDKIISTAALYDLYYVKEGETPDILASKMYGDSNLHWILMHTNVVINPFFDWPLPSEALNSYVINKYPGTFQNPNIPSQTISNIYAVHHWELVSPIDYRNGMIMPSDTDRATFDSEYLSKLYDAGIEEIIPVTNYEYEDRVNDLNRQIKVFKAALIPEFKAEFNNYIQANQ